ncbi:MAG: hypothetical protein FWH01_03040 [Oscillospiraceae bacterium]|nr:hypothetical protein [Oscillospiraceae bacterium]
MMRKLCIVMVAVFIAAAVFAVTPFGATAAAEVAEGAAGADGAVNVDGAGADGTADGAEGTAAGAGNTAAGAGDAGAPSVRRARPSGVSLSDAVATAEKMYYCGELYLFADSMIKSNYELASIAADIKDSLGTDALARNRTRLNALTRKYNTLCDTYNSWVDVKADLEFFIDTIGARNVFTKSQLQTVYKRTLTVINDTQGLLEAAREHYNDPTATSRRDLTGAADKVIAAAAVAANAAAPCASSSIAAYRSLFDQFAQQAGIETEYKTWQPPE